jgi:hypothetical protein
MWSFEPFCSAANAATDAKLHITELLTLGDDNVVKKLDAKDFTGFSNALGQLGVLAAGSGVA